jgi:hypothetical protein
MEFFHGNALAPPTSESKGETIMKQYKVIGVRGLRVKSGVKAGGLGSRSGGIAENHNETPVRVLPKVRGIRVKSGVKAELNVVNFPFGLERQGLTTPALSLKAPLDDASLSESVATSLPQLVERLAADISRWRRSLAAAFAAN